MNMEKILSLLGETLEKDVEEIRRFPSGAPLTELGLDSIRFIRFIVAFEEAFDVEILDSDLLLSNFETLDVLFSTLQKYIEKPMPLKKVLVCDCDNVLWHGIAGEEKLGIDEAVLDFQQDLIRLYDGGILLCLCSRNEPEHIDEAFATLDMPLCKEHFICTRINRQDKARNLKEMAAELNLSLDSFVFVDDSDYEIGLIRSLLPDVETVKADYADLSFMDTLKTLFRPQASQDSNRTQLYREQKEREKAKQRFSAVEEYNQSLDTRLTCTLATQDQAERIAELSQRTNQCNLSGVRYTKEEIEAFLSCDEYGVLSLAVTDTYGDMGIVGAAVVHLAEKRAVVEGFFLSCRVFDRGFETVLLDKIKEVCAGKALSGVYRPPQKKRRYCHFYEDNGVAVYE